MKRRSLVAAARVFAQPACLGGRCCGQFGAPSTHRKQSAFRCLAAGQTTTINWTGRRSRREPIRRSTCSSARETKPTVDQTWPSHLSSRRKGYKPGITHDVPQFPDSWDVRGERVRDDERRGSLHRGRARISRNGRRVRAGARDRSRSDGSSDDRDVFAANEPLRPGDPYGRPRPCGFFSRKRRAALGQPYQGKRLLER